MARWNRVRLGPVPFPAVFRRSLRFAPTPIAAAAPSSQFLVVRVGLGTPLPVLLGRSGPSRVVAGSRWSHTSSSPCLTILSRHPMRSCKFRCNEWIWSVDIDLVIDVCLRFFQVPRPLPRRRRRLDLFPFQPQQQGAAYQSYQASVPVGSWWGRSGGGRCILSGRYGRWRFPEDNACGAGRCGAEI